MFHNFFVSYIKFKLGKIQMLHLVMKGVKETHYFVKLGSETEASTS